MRRLGKIRPKKGAILSAVELTGSPEAIAVENTDAGYLETEEEIGTPRASSLMDCCIRMHVLGTLNKVKYKRRITSGERLTFAIGDLVHSWIQNTSDVLGDNRYGRWKCEVCGNISGFGAPRRRACKKCGTKGLFKYHEFALETKEPFPCTGHPDLFIMKNGKLRLLEIKTINGNDFAKLAMPLGSHQWQIAYYKWACSIHPKLGKLIDPMVGYVLYATKAHNRDIPYRMFVVQRDHFLLDQIKTKLNSYHLGVTKNEIPVPLSACKRDDFTSWTARSCPCLDLCKEEK